jgi:hypothetical protein
MEATVATLESRVEVTTIPLSAFAGAGPDAQAVDAAIRRICRSQAMPGRVRVTFEREPEFSLGCRAAGDDCQILVARAVGSAGGSDAETSSQIAGVACRSVRRLFVNGAEQRLGYLSQLRVDRKFQGRWLVSRGFRALRALHDADPLPAYLTAIVEGNREATGVLLKNRRKSFPVLCSVAELRTLAISVAAGKHAPRCGASISSACDADASEIAAFLRREGARRQFFPAHTEDSLRALAAFGLRLEDFLVARSASGEIAGVIALWDQSSYKQTVVRGYSGWLRAAAPLLNWSAPWTGRSAMPRPGEKLRSAYAAFVCIANDEAPIFRALLAETLNVARRRGFTHVLLGMDARDPLLPVAQRFKHISYPSRLYLAEWTEGETFHEQLDDRPVYADIATL